MSSITPFTCLFCQHVNPAGAIFCNSCAAQLNLQPCLNCDAVDDRMATHCYKCGTPFPPRQMPEPDAADSSLAPHTAQTSPAEDHAVVAPEEEAPPRQDLTSALTVTHQPRDRTPPDAATSAAVYRGDWLMSGTAFLLVVLAVVAYLYLRSPQKSVQAPDTKSLVQMAPTAPVTPAASGVAPPVNAMVTPDDPHRPSAVGAHTAGSPLPMAPSPLTNSEAATRAVPPQGNECVPAVAALGLCNP